MKKFDQKLIEGILFTDQYELTMAQLYFKLGYHEKKVHFDHFFPGTRAQPAEIEATCDRSTEIV